MELAKWPVQPSSMLALLAMYSLSVFMNHEMSLSRLRYSSLFLLAFTYGDPSFYSKTGFERINESIVKAPCPLSHPVGWLAQSLDGQAIQPMTGATKCVEALNDHKLW
jgi:hypothetical protein